MTSKTTVPEFEATAIEAIPDIARTVRQTFRTHKTKDVEWRLVQLRKLYWSLTDLAPVIAEALHRDLRKSRYEAFLSEIDWLRDDCMFMIRHLKSFARDEKLGSPSVPLSFRPLRLRLRKEPLGAVLILGAYNYPVHLSLAPLVGAIAAGCTAVVKPSENAPASAMVCREVLRALDPAAFVVVNGGPDQAAALLDQKWDKILYTGSAQVARIIAQKAAETLTPVCLELGGRNPAFVTRHADVALAARRLLWAKTHNAGQICMAHNYVLVDEEVVRPFVDHLHAAARQFFPDGARASPDLSRIVNLRHFHRIKRMLDNTRGQIVLGGQTDEDDLFIEPTAVLVDAMDDIMVQEEAFGPVFAIYPVHSLDEALNIARRVDPTPLALFACGSTAENERILNEITSGGATLNDSFFHGSVNTVPFGGVGGSGMGAYRGKASFDVWTHTRSVAETPRWMEPLIRVRYMPYKWSELRRLRLLNGGGTPDFDRNGRVVRGFRYWVAFVLRLGAPGVKGALLRWLFLLAAGYVAALRRSL